MTEAEWLAWASFPKADTMLHFVRASATQRKTRLVAANWIRGMATNFVGSQAEDIAESIEQTADQEIEAAESPFSANAWLNCALTTHPDELAYQFAVLLDTLRAEPPEQRTHFLQDFEARESHLTNAVREQFGNPFRPVAFDPAWRTDTAVTLARQMYDSREFGAMPILADALQDAGCEDEQVLHHCRDANHVHVRGCWVVDGVLGLS